MPSYRCSIHIVDVRPGHAPDEVMAAAVAGVERHHLVEASQLDLVRGMPIVRVRYLVESASQSAEDAEALDAAAGLAQAVDAVAVHGEVQVTRRLGGRWYRVIPGTPAPPRTSPGPCPPG